MKKKKNEKTIISIRRALCYIALILISIMCLMCFFILIINSTRSHPDIQKGFSFLPGKSLMKNISNVLENENLPVVRGVLNSIFISICVAFLTTYFSALTAYGVHVYNFKLKKSAFTFILMIMMIPTQVSALGFIKQMTFLGLMDNYAALILPSIAAPVVFFFMIQYMKSVLPLEIVEAARIDGCGEFRTFNQIILPIIKPAMAIQAIFAFVSSWNNYFIPALVISSTEKKTLPILIAQLRSADFLKFDMGQVYVLIAIAIVPLMVVYLIFSKYIVSGVTAGSVKG